ncbi:MAG TPA: 16S rRNA (guanine(527)-N(7))-methyltransferase RsmG [Candidatus Obscuribacterales bacterium]
MSGPIPNLDEALADLRARGSRLGVGLSPDAISAVAIFCRALAEYSQHTNLVADASPGVVVAHHVLDSLTLVPLLSRLPQGDSACGPSAASLVDIGSGAGFPGLVLAIACPHLKVTLLESIAKKTRFLQSVVDALGEAERISVINARAEDLAGDNRFRESFDFATARAVGSADLVLELALPLVRTGGAALIQKSRAQVEDEMARAERAAQILGGGRAELVIPDVEALGKEHVVIAVRKVSKTPSRYPRSMAQIKRHALGSGR